MYKAVQQAGDIELLPIDLIEFNSSGRLLVIAESAQFTAMMPYLADLQLFFSSSNGEEADIELENVRLINQPITSIDGWLGAFNVRCDELLLEVDLVLDLSSKPLMANKVSPLGYFAVAKDAQKLAETLQKLPDLIGTFDKPRYFDYKASICVHSRRGIIACHECLDLCPAGAITSEGEALKVNPSLCQGCGSCTAVCPSGAISYVLPSLDVSLDRLRNMLNTYFELNDAPPKLLIHDLSQGQLLLAAKQAKFDNEVICFSIEEIAALGMPFWLSAFAYGVGHIRVWDAGSHHDHDWAELQQEMDKTMQLLSGMGFGDNLLSWYAGNEVTLLTQQLHSAEVMQIPDKAKYAGIDDKRRVINLALGYLNQQAQNSLDVLALDNRAAFGLIEVDKQKCTLCMSCVSVCPMGAVLDGRDKPQLNFVEDLCVQCGMCEQACPQDAIDLNPRYLFNREQARQTRVLHQEDIFHCISCNKPFATQKMIDTMAGKLKDHPMFQGEAFERLKMCEDCRVKSIF